MFKQFLLVLFLVAQSSIIFAAVPDISGTYSGSSSGGDTCSDGSSTSWQDSISNFNITQKGSSFSATYSGSDGESSWTSNFTGTVDNSGNIIGNYTLQGQENSVPGDAVGTLTGSFDSSNNQLRFSTTGKANTYNADGSLYETCQEFDNVVLTRTAIQISTTEPITEIQATTGTSFSITPTDVFILTISGTIPDIGALLTLEDSSTTIKRDDGSTLEIKQKAVVTLNPESITLIRGEITATVNCNYEVLTPLANITSCPTVQRSSTSVKFTTSYSQTGLDGTLKVNVITGTVDVTDRNGTTFTVSAGEEKTITSRVPRTQWVLPIDEDKLYGGKDNFLIWRQFPDAASYQMEFNLPSPVFAEQNVSTPQFTKQVIPLAGYIEFEGLALLTLPLPKGADGLVLELRIFALDNKGNIIGESTSSDSTKATLTD